MWRHRRVGLEGVLEGLAEFSQSVSHYQDTLARTILYRTTYQTIEQNTYTTPSLYRE